jgi:hypothetical protein
MLKTIYSNNPNNPYKLYIFETLITLITVVTLIILINNVVTLITVITLINVTTLITYNTTEFIYKQEWTTRTTCLNCTRCMATSRCGLWLAPLWALFYWPSYLQVQECICIMFALLSCFAILLFHCSTLTGLQRSSALALFIIWIISTVASAFIYSDLKIYVKLLPGLFNRFLCECCSPDGRQTFPKCCFRIKPKRSWWNRNSFPVEFFSPPPLPPKIFDLIGLIVSS